MTSRRDFLAAGAALLPLPSSFLVQSGPYDLVFRGASVFDGTGAPGREADVAVRGTRIAAIAARLTRGGRTEIDGRGLALTPGFIDIHSHGDSTLTADPGAESVIRQGITTIVVGQDGGSRHPDDQGRASFTPWFRRMEGLPVSVNVATMVGLGTVRRRVVGEDNRPATPTELRRMTGMVEAALASGACGASSGLEYTPGAFASRQELITLCRPLSRRRLPYATHMRNEDDTLLEAIDEAIAVARAARCPLQISHLKTGGKANWRKITAVFERLASARRARVDLHFDRYPYTAWATGLTNLFPVWALDGGSDAFLRRLADPDSADRIRKEALEKVELVGGWNNVLLSSVRAEPDRDAVGKRLDEWAASRGLPPYEAAVGLLRNSSTAVSTVVFAMSEDNLERFLAHPYAMVCSDGGSFAVAGPARSGHPHPRGLGTFPRVLGRYVRERKVLTFENAIHKMTELPARKLRLAGRGRIAVGSAADLVLLDPARIIDRASYEDPFQYPEGISAVVVNGRLALRDGERAGTGAGKGLKPTP